MDKAVPESNKAPLFYIAIISHGHAEALLENTHLLDLARQPSVRLVIVDNLVESPLQAFCTLHEIDYLHRDGPSRGFGSNNNLAFAFFDRRYRLSSSDYFICCNPDVVVDSTNWSRLQETLSGRLIQLSAINLFTDPALTVQDPSIRHFMGISDYVKMLLGEKNPAGIDRSAMCEPVHCDWAAGSFLIFAVDLYRALKGFDERYFMYFEDADICLRAWRLAGVRVCYLPEVRAYHRGGLLNRNIFSRHFYWYVKSMLRYFLRLYLGGRIPSREQYELKR
ncbi:MAG: glycosyltransferase family 2 protein [Pseudomonadota bacterium]